MLFDPTAFRDLVSGKRRGVLPVMTRCALAVAEVPYSLVVSRRNRRFDGGQTEIHRVGVPVISVGNLTLGGTGKTPVVEWIARWFRERGVRVCIVSRGYGAEEGSRNDEALELEQKLPDVPHVQNPNRVEAAQMAIEEFETQLMLLDDGFQHRRIASRSRHRAARRARAVRLRARLPARYAARTAGGFVARRRRRALRVPTCCRLDERARDSRDASNNFAPACRGSKCVTRRGTLLDWRGDERIAGIAARQTSRGFCGIGNPAGFRRTLAALRLRCRRVARVSRSSQLHARRYRVARRWAKEQHAAGAAAVVCTHKDLGEDSVALHRSTAAVGGGDRHRTA